jgi:acetoin utilization deacetylase AcuC-like enzyme
LAFEFNPDLILVSAGFDAALGCPEGQMKVTPAAFGHMVNSMMAFAQGRIGLFLEGGYFVESLAESVAFR